MSYSLSTVKGFVLKKPDRAALNNVFFVSQLIKVLVCHQNIELSSWMRICFGIHFADVLDNADSSTQRCIPLY